MILTIGNVKGGVGKSTIAVNIAAVLAQRGADTLLIDGDDQGSAATFAGLRAELPGQRNSALSSFRAQRSGSRRGSSARNTTRS